MDITDKQRDMYRLGYYRFKTPAVITQSWSEDDWIRYIGEDGFCEKRYDLDSAMPADAHHDGRGYN